MHKKFLVILFFSSPTYCEEIKQFKSARNQGMNYFERFEYIENYLIKLSKQHISLHKQDTPQQIREKEEKIQALQKK
ncbi:MAG: hypothetical protein OXB84_02740, partial [Halobacteriovoraceae bacterium]|nr:hypothetical protein [Halobacteriovoraceae bacterium]